MMVVGAFSVIVQPVVEPMDRFTALAQCPGVVTPCSGMVGEVMTGAADLALADLTITAARERVVDFTVPFLQTGITVLHTAIQ